MAGSPSAPAIPRISIQMTDEDIIARVAAIFGVKYHTIPPKDKPRKTYYTVVLRGFHAVVLMKQLSPLMSQRRQAQIERACQNFVFIPGNKGEKHGTSKLNNEKVKAIKIRLAQGESCTTIAYNMGVSPRTISDINCGKTWSHITI